MKRILAFIAIIILVIISGCRTTKALDLSIALELSKGNSVTNDKPLETIIEARRQEIRAREVKKAEEAEKARIAELWRSYPAGNNYTWGNCTWFVANVRAVPMGLGNANTWFYRAKAWGFATGSEPRVGAVAVSTRGYYGHVAYVLEVKGDLILVREMNVRGLGRVSEAWYSSSNYLYIY